MSQNPFDALGGEGGFDMNALLAQAQEMQAQLTQAHERLQAARFTGAAGGQVSVEIAGSGELTGVTIAPGAFDGSSVDDLEVIGDLVVAAYRDAKTKADAEAQASLGPMAGPMPGLG
jgi:DNA-binding protein YbaB